MDLTPDVPQRRQLRKRHPAPRQQPHRELEGNGHGHYFDEILLNTQGLNRHPYQLGGPLRVQV